ncbi:MAG: hypothetical protein Q9213_002220 [Squamulea squamosa]
MDALSMSKAECRQVYLQSNGKPYDKIVIGALIIKHEPEGGPKILLLKRAAHEEYYPTVFEIPGGKVEESDPTILSAVKREVLEETGLEVDEVIEYVGSFEYSMEKKTASEAGGQESILSTSLQFNFICRVSQFDVVVNPEEHSEGRFVSQSEIADLTITDQMRAVVDQGFTWVSGDRAEATEIKA